MTLLLPIFLAELVVVLLAVVVGVIVVTRAVSPQTLAAGPARAAARRIRITYGVAAVLGVAFALWAASTLPLGVWVSATSTPGLLAALSPSIAGLVYVGVAAVGEATWPRPKGEQRAAFLTPRPALALPRLLPAVFLWVWAALLTLTLVVFGVIALPGGRSLAGIVADPSTMASSGGPFPGWPYGLPMLVAAALLVAATLAVRHQIARRPAVYTADPATDDALRERSATALVKGVQLSLATSLVGELAAAGMTAHNQGWWWGLPAVFLGIAAFGTALALLAVRGAR